MALAKLRRPENADGGFYVDNTCIDCDLCRQIAPQSFSLVGEQSIVHRQPFDEETEQAALQALITCPTASIGAPRSRNVQTAIDTFPQLIDVGVYFCGFASKASYGASSYLIVRPEGNVLVDSPRFARPLVERIENHGGARLMFLTHIDDVADHKAWARTCGAERIMHSRDLGRSLAGIEKVISGDEPVAIGEGLLAIPTPGHTRGHMVLLYQNRYLFSGDHFRWSDDQHSLRASLDVCWFSWEEQIRSMERLLQYSFEWVLPGHGRRAHFTAAEMHRHLSDCIRSMKPERITP